MRMTGYELLAIAILNQAVKDYRVYRKQLESEYMTEIELTYVENAIIELEEFFLSEYGQLLSKGLGVDIVARLRTERIE